MRVPSFKLQVSIKILLNVVLIQLPCKVFAELKVIMLGEYVFTYKNMIL